jgi:hypothetical protein
VTPDTLFIGVGTDSRNLIIGEAADVATDWALAQQTNPTLVVQSAVATSVAQRVTIAHNQVNGIISALTGDLVISPAGNDLELGTGATGIDYAFKVNGETSDGSMTYMEDEDRWDLTEQVKVTGYVASSAGFIGMHGSTYFCGQGANGTTATYIGPAPHTVAADTTTYDFGEAGCDGLDSTTETTADRPLQFGSEFKATAMRCWHSAGGTNDIYTFQARDDAGDITGLVCSTMLDTTAKGCSVVLTTPVTVSAGSAVAIKEVASVDDDMSAADTECILFYTF